MEENVPIDPYFLDPTKSFIRKKGKDITLIGFGSSISETINVSKKLENQNISCEILDLRTINPIDTKTIINSVKKTGRIAVIENGWPVCSVASEILSIVSETINLKCKGMKFCWPASHIPTSHILEKEFYHDVDKISQTIMKVLKNR